MATTKISSYTAHNIGTYIELMGGDKKAVHAMGAYLGKSDKSIRNMIAGTGYVSSEDMYRIRRLSGVMRSPFVNPKYPKETSPQVVGRAFRYAAQTAKNPSQAVNSMIRALQAEIQIKKLMAKQAARGGPGFPDNEIMRLISVKRAMLKEAGLSSSAPETYLDLYDFPAEGHRGFLRPVRSGTEP